MLDKNTKWEKQAKAAKATQVAFDVSETVHKNIQKQSVDHQLKPSDFIRKMLGLEYKAKKVRPRLTVTLSEEDYQKLGELFSIDPNDHIAIKHAVAKKLIEVVENKG
ncbi:hypothetical protein [Aliikangiella coralliicola]|uniref:Uncharacterized protein n=1 Tax=Aliikangiella coralliicola TaxID=2592383 RepID=A0A545UGB0_9GAMM|nr:hypothetical protein [Aliikangiella coralliicola]TQV88516.1 hypothetical protein FLL46_08315 [Aliikangiella coralliicola]